MQGNIQNNISPILLSIQMIVDNFEEHKLKFIANTAYDAPHFSNCMVYSGQKELSQDSLYIIPEGKGKRFPKDKFSYITTENIEGKSPHIRSISIKDIDLINLVLNLFQEYREFESKLNSVITGNGSLDDLCQVGIDFFNNPLYVHDNMFCILSLPLYVKGMREFDYDKESGKNYIPLWLINDFKFDDEYKKTLTQHKANFWGNEQFPRDARCVYVNIWEGSYYMGRLLIEELQSPIKPGQLAIAEYFANYIKYIMRRDSLDDTSDRHDYETTFRNLLNNRNVSEKDLATFMNIMNWDEADSYLCIKTISQDANIPVNSDSSLRSKYADIFSSFFSFYNENQCCLLVNTTKSRIEGQDISAELAPLIRESYLYAGISNTFHSIKFVPQAFKQADIALNATDGKDGRWINTFNQCVLGCMIDSLEKTFPIEMIVVPELFDLVELDRKRNSKNYLTLKTYLMNERDIRITSEVLSIHRTTLIYRLEKISQILKMDIDNPSVRLYLLICFNFIDKQIIEL